MKLEMNKKQKREIKRLMKSEMNKKQKIEMKKLFPLSSTLGSDMSDLNREYMKVFSDKNMPLKEIEFIKILKDHEKFLKTGGAGGSWNIMNINSLIVGIYVEKFVEPNMSKGKQAVINFRKLEQLNTININLKWANLVGIVAEKQNFNRSDLSNSLITDSHLSNSIFEKVNLENTDFSRSNMKNCCFKGANLKGADFENCDLTNADFEGAILDGSHFPGAILENIRY